MTTITNITIAIEAIGGYEAGYIIPSADVNAGSIPVKSTESCL